MGSHITHLGVSQHLTKSMMKSFVLLRGTALVRKAQDRQCMCNVTLRCVCETMVLVEKKQVLHILRMSSMQGPCTILSFVACRPLQYFSTSHIWHDLKKIIGHEVCVFIFTTTFSETFLILRRIK